MSQHLDRRALALFLLVWAAVVVGVTRPQPGTRPARWDPDCRPVRKGIKASSRSLGMLALLLASCSGLPPQIDRITIVNPTGYDLSVEVTDRDRGGWLSVTIAEARAEDVAHEVIDQGEVWIFRFLHSGDPVGELSLTRAELEENGWRVEVPAEVEERLQQMGRPMSGEFVEPGGDAGT